MLHQNVGGVDRAIRVLAGAVVLTIGLVLLVSGRSYGWLLSIVGLMALGSGLVGFCGLYLPLGISTRTSAVSSCCPGVHAHRP